MDLYAIEIRKYNKKTKRYVSYLGNDMREAIDKLRAEFPKRVWIIEDVKLVVDYNGRR
ncbi:hypothetical protein OGA_03073 [Enterococcus faecium EnGen0012]|uniref:hypothetical protein n=1 Tax=Enterococcus faecium TaxID=1352 RepID=UPI0002A44008|nr:hypothetical protein [Enterococcus faecium]ELA53552.1 hypothetical protein OGA_03073 [Enterococcus faecium EnGen0012]HAZ4706297.1 hypothetical protein [Enterococcus faecium]